MQILFAFILLAACGILFALFLVIAAKKLYVEPNKKAQEILELLPKANCGACGFPGCAGYADALAAPDYKIAVNLCAPGGADLSDKLAALTGATAVKSERKTARLLCRGEVEYIRFKYEYKGIEDCEMAARLLTGPKYCEYGCLMFGNCYRACKFDAIKFEIGELPRISQEKCVGCGACVEACPKKLITLLPIKNNVFVSCKNLDKGKLAKEKCDITCIGCGLCKKKCPVNAIEIINNLSVIDYSKCIDCGQCYTVCPVKPIKAITDYLDPRPILEINDNCRGCTLCAKKCPVNAITGVVKTKHSIDKTKCIRCQVCYNVCRFSAIDKLEK